MKSFINYFLIFITIIISAVAKGNSYKPGNKMNKVIFKLSSNWEFRQVGNDKWYPASVPGCVHTDLLSNKLIEDPFYRLNEKKLQWIGEKNWEYRTTFKLSQDILDKENIQLFFKGLDTYADIYMNNQLVLKADNMFREWAVDIKRFAHLGDNTIRILFHNVFDVNIPKYNNAVFRLNAFPNNDQADVKISLYSRKAGYEYGWDWGPRLITSGIWRPVMIEAWNTAKIDNMQVVQNTVNKNVAHVTSILEVVSTKAINVEIKLSLDEKMIISKDIKLQAGRNKIPVDFEIDKPNLWWTNGLGSQYLYKIKSQLVANRQLLDEKSVNIGIRSLKIVREKDSIGHSFYVELNGVPVFMKGSNYIPQDNFLNRVTPAQVKYMVKSAADVHMNMLRVWGGGIYPDDVFYDMCDKYGILVWQDMMFACGMFPGDKDFKESVRQEIRDNVKRMRNHPSIALYNGNNENEVAWYNWGWKEEFPENIQKEYESNLHDLFYNVVPNAIKEVDSTRYYHPTSPNTGYLNIPITEGDMHYWGVWHGKEPFSEYNNKISRFMSEYGFQSYPDFSTIQKFSIAEDWNIHTPVMQSHQRCMADERKDTEYGNRLIQLYMDNDYRKAKDFKSFLYLSQVVQADGVKMAVEAHRRHMKDKFCMGTLYWQINDCWPVASWSSIDYYGNWKALHYYVNKVYAPVILSALTEQNEYKIYAVSDKLSDISDAQLSIKVINFSGKTLKEVTENVNIPANTSTMVNKIDTADFYSGIDKKNVFVVLSLSQNGKEIYRDIKTLVSLKYMNLPKPVINIRRIEKSLDNEMILTSSTVAKNVYVSLIDETGKQLAANFTDNYFDLLPGESRTIKLHDGQNIGKHKIKVQAVSLVDSYE